MMSVEGEGESGDKLQLSQDLTEATLDMLTRYTYSNISSLPSRYVCVCVVLEYSPSSSASVSVSQIVWCRLLGVRRTQQDLGARQLSGYRDNDRGSWGEGRDVCSV